jgi:hypothetical protein
MRTARESGFPNRNADPHSLLRTTVEINYTFLTALLIMWPELLALPVALMTCKGYGCAGFVAFLFLASLFTLILMAVSFGAFFIRRRRT